MTSQHSHYQKHQPSSRPNSLQRLRHALLLRSGEVTAAGSLVHDIICSKFYCLYFQVKVEIVVQFFKVGEIDTLKEQFNADVIVKAKWREPTLDGQQTAVSLEKSLFK